MKGYHTKRITLPGGKVIEIVYFNDDAPGDASGTAATAPEGAGEEPSCDHDARGGLHTCPRCASDLVYPVVWEERSGDRWQIERRCPNCEWRGVGEFAQDDVEDFDDVLNDGTECLLRCLRDFSRSNMEADVGRIIDAINADLIQPMDF